MRFPGNPWSSRKRSVYGRNFVFLLVGGGVAYAIPLAVSPLLTRLYSPAEMGAAALISTTIGVASTVITGRYEIPIGFVPEDRDGAALARAAIFVTMILALAAAVVMAVFQAPVRGWLRHDLLGHWIWLLPLGFLFQGVMQTATLCLNRKERFAELVVAKAIRSLLNVTVGLAMGTACLGPGGLVAGTVTGLGFAAGFSVWRMPRHLHEDGKWWAWDSSLWATLRKFVNYPLYNATTSLLDSLSLSAPIFFLLHFFSASEAGAYSLCLMVFGAATALVMESVTQASLTPFAAAIRNGEGVRDIMLARMRDLAIGAVLVLVPITLAAPQLFAFGFGTRWMAAGQMAQWVAWVFAIRLLVSPFSFVLNIVGWNRRLAAWKLGYFIATFAVLYATAHWGLVAFLWGFLLNEVACYGIYAWLTIRAAEAPAESRLCAVGAR